MDEMDFVGFRYIATAFWEISFSCLSENCLAANSSLISFTSYSFSFRVANCLSISDAEDVNSRIIVFRMCSLRF